jgi:membrane protein
MAESQVEDKAVAASGPPNQNVDRRVKERRDPDRVPPAPPAVREARRRHSLSPKAVFELLKMTFTSWSNDKVPRMGAALAYYTIFSLAPLLVIAISIAGLVFGAKAVQGQIMGEIQGLIGPDSAKAVQTMIQSAHKPANSMIASLIGLVVLLLGASGVFTEMQDALNTIWDVDTKGKSGVWNYLKGRFSSFGMVLGIGFLLLVSLVLSAALAAMANYLESVVTIPAALLHSVDFLFSVFTITALFAMIFKLLPDARIRWSDVWVGAALTSVLFTIGKFLIGFYIGKSVTASTYGAAGSLVIIVAWIYYSAQLLYFGAEFTHVYSQQCGSQCEIPGGTTPEAAKRGPARRARTLANL